jgi:hypothetical protein
VVSLSHPPGDVDAVTATGANTCDPVSEASSLLEPMCYVCSAAASGSFGLDCLRWWMPITRSSASLRSIALSSASAVLREARVGVGLPRRRIATSKVVCRSLASAIPCRDYGDHEAGDHLSPSQHARPQSLICDAQQYWTQHVTCITESDAKDVLVVLKK